MRNVLGTISTQVQGVQNGSNMMILDVSHKHDRITIAQKKLSQIILKSLFGSYKNDKFHRYKNGHVTQPGRWDFTTSWGNGLIPMLRANPDRSFGWWDSPRMAKHFLTFGEENSPFVCWITIRFLMIQKVNWLKSHQSQNLGARGAEDLHTSGMVLVIVYLE